MERRTPPLISPENYSLGKEAQLFRKQKCTYLQVVNVTMAGYSLEDVTLVLNCFYYCKSKYTF